MGIRPIFDLGHNIVNPTIVLCHRYFSSATPLKSKGIIYPVDEFEITPDMHQTNELSFKIYRNSCAVWDDVTDLSVIYIPEYNEYFQKEWVLCHGTGACGRYSGCIGYCRICFGTERTRCGKCSGFQG